MKKDKSKLVLKAETIQELVAQELEKVGGGAKRPTGDLSCADSCHFSLCDAACTT